MNPAALREKSYFDQRATQEMQQHLRAVPAASRRPWRMPAASWR